MTTADPMAWYRLDPAEMGQESYDDTVSAVNDPRVVRAMLGRFLTGQAAPGDLGIRR